MDAIIQIGGFILIGIVIGVIARLIRPGKQHLSFPVTVLVGMVGALIGGIVATLLGTGSLDELDFIGFVVAVIAGVILVGIAEGAASKK